MTKEGEEEGGGKGQRRRREGKQERRQGGGDIETASECEGVGGNQAPPPPNAQLGWGRERTFDAGCTWLKLRSCGAMVDCIAVDYKIRGFGDTLTWSKILSRKRVRH